VCDGHGKRSGRAWREGSQMAGGRPSGRSERKTLLIGKRNGRPRRCNCVEVRVVWILTRKDL